MKKSVVIDVVCGLLILLFLYASVSKFLDFDGFIHDMNNQPFPNWMTPFLVWLVPVTEIIIVVFLIIEKSRLIGLYMSLVLMSLFTIYTALVLFHVFDRVPCSCGGVIKKLNWQQHMLLNLVFVVLVIIAIALYKRRADKIVRSNTRFAAQ